MILMYKAYIQPIFDYNNIFLENTHIRLKTKLKNLQRRCLRRCLPENRRYNRNEIYTESGVNTLRDRADTHLLKLMYKRSRDPKYLDGNALIQTRRRDAPTRWVPFPSFETTRKSVIYRGSELWNNQPPGIRNIPTFEAYKDNPKQENRRKLNA